MAPVGFEPTTPAGERPQTYALDRAATGTGWKEIIHRSLCLISCINHVRGSSFKFDIDRCVELGAMGRVVGERDF